MATAARRRSSAGCLKARGGTRPFVATKTGREGPNKPEDYNKANITKSVEGSLKRLQTDALDLVQLHCPHPAVYYMPEVFDILDGLKKDGKLKHYGVSVEKVEEGLKAIEYPGRRLDPDHLQHLPPAARAAVLPGG